MAYEALSEDAFQSHQTAAYVAAYERLADDDAAGARQAFATLVGQYGDDPLALFHLQRLLGGKTSVRIELTAK